MLTVDLHTHMWLKSWARRQDFDGLGLLLAGCVIYCVKCDTLGQDLVTPNPRDVGQATYAL